MTTFTDLTNNLRAMSEMAIEDYQIELDNSIETVKGVFNTKNFKSYLPENPAYWRGDEIPLSRMIYIVSEMHYFLKALSILQDRNVITPEKGFRLFSLKENIDFFLSDFFDNQIIELVEYIAFHIGHPNSIEAIIQFKEGTKIKVR
jgi:hypothetical protein